ncbi:MAG TPA: DUF885 family protein [archaeon]|nr:DUF885 family protein [archaeon]
MSTISHRDLKKEIEKYLSFMAESFPVMCASDEFIFFPRAEGSFRFPGAMEDLSPGLIEEGIARSRNVLAFLEKLSLEKDIDLDLETDAWLLRMHAKNYLRTFETERLHFYDPSLYFMVATQGLVMAAGDLSALASRLDRAARLFRCAERQLVSASTQRMEQGLVWSANFTGFLDELAQSLSQRKKPGNTLSGKLNALHDQAVSLGRRLKRLELSAGPECLGKRRYAELAEDAFGLKKDPQELYEILLDERTLLLEKLQVSAVSLGKEPSGWRLLAADPPLPHPKRKSPVDWYQAELDHLVRWLAESPGASDINTRIVPEVRPMPGYLRGLRAFASYSACAGRRRQGIFFIGSDSASGSLSARLAAHADYRYITVHETFPGHHHLDTVRKGLKSPIRRQSENALFYEGWACWAEQRMVDSGYFHRPEELMCILRRRLQRCVRSICELGLHLGHLDDARAAELLKGIDLEGGPATQLIRQYRCQPGYQLTYTIGRLELEKLVKKFRPLAQGDGEFYRLMLSAGEIPFDLLERHLERHLLRSNNIAEPGPGKSSTC